MRRPLTIATFVLLLASVPAVAQHGAGHAGGGHAGFGGGGHMSGFSGHSGFSGGDFSGGMRAGSAPSRGFAHGPSFTQRSFSQRNFQRRSFSNRPFLHDDFRGRRNRFFGSRNCFGLGCGYYYPYGYSGFYDPYWWSDSGSSSSYDEDYERNRAEASEMDQQSLAEQRMRRQEDADGDQDSYNQDSSAKDSYARSTQPQRAPESDSAVPATVLVFRDQHQQEVRNYAIVGQTLWSFGPRTQKIPLADLNLAATTKANDDRGLTFRVPAANEAQ
jgi:hypothetical protein